MKEIYILEKDNNKKIFLIENNIILEKYEENAENSMKDGNIYIGKVNNVLPGMQAAFVNIGSRKKCFYSFKRCITQNWYNKRRSKKKWRY